MAKKERYSLTRLTASLWSKIQAEREVTPRSGIADHKRETYLGGEEERVVVTEEGKGKGTEQRHPSYAVAA